MGIFKFFGRSKNEKEETVDWQAMQPMERFVKRFTDKGGRFLLSMPGSGKDLLELLLKILKEEQKDKYYTSDESLLEKLLSLGIPVQLTPKAPKDAVFLLKTQFLIEAQGDIMITGKQTGGMTPEELPRTLVFLARPRQLVTSVEEAMTRINRMYKSSDYPANIRTLQHFGKEQNHPTAYLVLYDE